MDSVEKWEIREGSPSAQIFKNLCEGNVFGKHQKNWNIS